MSDHPNPADLEAFVEGRLDTAATARVVAHLLPGCEACGRNLEALGLEPAGLEEEVEGVWDVAYDEALDRAAERVRLHGTQALARSRKIRRALERMEREGIEALSVRQVGRPAMIEVLLTRCRQLRHDDPEQMVLLAWQASWIARRLDRDGFTPEQVMDLRARTSGEYANALRVADRLPDAEVHLRQAFHYFEMGTGDADAELRLLDLKASLRGSQHRYAEAVELLEIVHDRKIASGDRHGSGRALIKKGIYVGRGGAPVEALALLEEGSALLDPQKEPELERLALHNRLYFLVDCKRLDEALALLEWHRSLLMSGGRFDECKLVRNEGLIYAALGRWELAERAFRTAKEGFTSLKVMGHAALMALDLSTVLMRQGKASEAITHAYEAIRVFSELDVRDEQAEALLALAEALRADLVTAGLLEAVTEFLRRSEHDPKARFEVRFG